MTRWAKQELRNVYGLEKISPGTNVERGKKYDLNWKICSPGYLLAADSFLQDESPTKCFQQLAGNSVLISGTMRRR
jgi:hypothetical protein